MRRIRDPMFDMKEWCQVLGVAYWPKSRRDLIVPFKGAEQSALCDALALQLCSMQAGDLGVASSPLLQHWSPGWREVWPHTGIQTEMPVSKGQSCLKHWHTQTMCARDGRYLSREGAWRTTILSIPKFACGSLEVPLPIELVRACHVDWWLLL